VGYEDQRLRDEKIVRIGFILFLTRVIFMLTGGMESFIEVKEEDGGDHR